MLDHSSLPLFSLQPETREIPLTQDKVAIVDADDYEWLSRYRWYYCESNQTGYARTSAKGKGAVMHRMILNAPLGTPVDHRNGNGLDNRRANIRLATTQQNNYNQRPRAGGSSIYKGVRLRQPQNRWLASIKINGRDMPIGYFGSEREAALAYNKAAIVHFGEFARINLPHELTRDIVLSDEPPILLTSDNYQRNAMPGKRGPRRVRKTSGSSRFLGVSFHKSTGRWRAEIYDKQGKAVWLGRFDTEAEAARAYDRAAREIHGSYAILNFSNE